MHYFEFAEKDATLYEKSGSLNSGLDEILEIRKDVSDAGDVITVSCAVIKLLSISSCLIIFKIVLNSSKSSGLKITKLPLAKPLSNNFFSKYFI